MRGHRRPPDLGLRSRCLRALMEVDILQSDQDTASPPAAMAWANIVLVVRSALGLGLHAVHAQDPVEVNVNALFSPVAAR